MTNNEKAQKEADEKNLLKPTEHCPLTNKECRSDCVCWQKSYVTGTTPYATVPCCDNGMFWRNCNHQD